MKYIPEMSGLFMSGFDKKQVSPPMNKRAHKHCASPDCQRNVFFDKWHQNCKSSPGISADEQLAAAETMKYDVFVICIRSNHF